MSSAISKSNEPFSRSTSVTSEKKLVAISSMVSRVSVSPSNTVTRIACVSLLTPMTLQLSSCLNWLVLWLPPLRATRQLVGCVRSRQGC